MTDPVRIEIDRLRRGEPAETLRFDLETPPEFCSICKKVPKIRLQLGLERGDEHFDISICRDCLAEYAPELLAEIEKAAPDVAP